MNLVTVITPTYNRADMLYNCYTSLKKQTNTRFQWMIVDDGSTDNTKEVVKKIFNENYLDIKYIRKENGGKHTALNKGVEKVKTPLTVILDSDDIFTDTAIETIELYYNKYNSISNICGYTFLKAYSNGEIMGNPFETEGRYNYIDLRLNNSKYGEKCDVFFTNKLKEIPFSVYPNEKYIGESTAWAKLGMKYDMISVNEIIYIAEYLPEGLTKNGREIRIMSPYGGMEYAELNIILKRSLFQKIKYSILYVAYAVVAGKSAFNIFLYGPYKLIKFTSFLPGYILGKYWEKLYKRDS